MRNTTIALLLTAALATGAVGCSDAKSKDEIAADCTAALKDRAKGDKEKPSACEGLSADDYDALLMSHVLKDDLGWVDEDGNVDKGEMLEDALEDQ